LKAVVQTQEAIYSYRNDGYSALLGALKDGSLSADGKKYSDGKKYTAEEIKEMRHSKVWKQHYQHYLLPKHTPPHVAKLKLKLLIKDFSGK
jgi:hypothetical protein